MKMGISFHESCLGKREVSCEIVACTLNDLFYSY